MSFRPEEPEDIDELRPFMDGADEAVDVVPMDTSFPQCIAVLQIPKVDDTKKPKLVNLMTKIFSQVGEIVKLEMPMEAGMSLGFAFIEFLTKEAAAAAADKINGYVLDKAHVFRVVPYTEVARLATLPASFQAPPAAVYEAKPDLESWLSDSAARDQFMVRFAAGGKEETHVSWSELGRPPVPYYGGEREKASGVSWCELDAIWSPKGSFLATFHPRGVALWGGDGMEKLGRFAHNAVNRLVFSPCERYMLTYTSSRGEIVWDSTVKFWDLETQVVLREFPLGFSRQGEVTKEMKEAGQEVRIVPNLFRWSADGGYVAHLAQIDDKDSKERFGPAGLIKIYQVPSMKLLDSKSVRCNGVMDFAWSPADNTLAYWCAEEGNTPARVCLMAIPSRVDLRQKNLFSVHTCSLTWAPTGDFLAAKVIRHTKSKKTKLYNLELFRAREALVPVETLDVKDKITSLAWEPGEGSTRFALLNQATALDGFTPVGKPSVSFYDMGKPADAESAAAAAKASKGKGSGLGAVAAAEKKPEVTLLKTLPARNCSHLFWSPVGTHIVLAGLPVPSENDYSGQLEFYDVDALADEGAKTDHYRANLVEWDPSGRMVVTAVTQPREGQIYKHQMDNGYHLWTFQGEKYFEKGCEKFYSFSWRPRPQSMLDKEATRAVVKNLRKFERKFERADREKRKERNLKQLAKQQAERQAFRDRLAMRKARSYDATRGERAAARYGVDVDAAEYYRVKRIVREVVVNVKEEAIGML